MSKNGLGHRPAGSWAEIEDELEREAEIERLELEKERDNAKRPKAGQSGRFGV